MIPKDQISRYPEYVHLLVKLGCDPTLRDNEGDTMLENLIRYRLSSVKTVLETQGIDKIRLRNIQLL
jgi:ankyrin repeat protein